MREQFDSRFRSAEGGNAGPLEQHARFADLLFAHPAGDQRFIKLVGDLDDCACGLGRIGHRLWGENRQHAVDGIVFHAGGDGRAIARRIGIANDIHRVGFRPCGRQGGVEFVERAFCQLGQRNADVGCVVSGHDARPAAVGDDHQAVAARTEMREQG